MKIKINKESVIGGIQIASNILPQKTGAAFLKMIWLEGSDNNLKIMSTDSKLEFSGNYSAQVLEDGIVGVQGKSFYDLFKRLPPGEIELNVKPEESVLFMKQGPRKYKLPTFDSTWF